MTHDPYFMRFEGVEFFIDLGAEKVIAAEKDDQKIAVEIKSFSSPSPIADFHTALGQFMNYRMALVHQEPERILYMAIPIDAYETFFCLPFGQTAVRFYQLKILVYSIEDEVITTWINT